MERRSPVRAGSFYPGSERACRAEALRCIGDYAPPPGLGDLVGGVVPHAGWRYSGSTAAKTFVSLRAASPETFVLLGAVHSPVTQRACAFPEGCWRTPLGDLQVDAEVLAAVRDAGIEVSTANHEGEHSIEVQLPFIQVLCPVARIVAVAVPHHGNAAEVGRRIGQALKTLARKTVVVASTDLTHYSPGYHGADHGPFDRARAWMRGNDGRMAVLIEALRAEDAVAEAGEYENACGAGAVAAALAAARELGARSGRTLEYTTSAEVTGEPDPDYVVGYLAAVLER